MGFLAPKTPTLPAPPPPPPAFGQIQGEKPQRKPMSPTMLGANTLPSGSMIGGAAALMGGGQTGKTLLGQ